MAGTVAFKVCDSSRRFRHIIPAFATISSLIEQASNAYQKAFSTIVLEENGCQVSTDFALSAFTTHLLMLLSSEEIWTPPSTTITSTAYADASGAWSGPQINTTDDLGEQNVTPVGQDIKVPQAAHIEELQLDEADMLMLIGDGDPPLPSATSETGQVTAIVKQDTSATEEEESSETIEMETIQIIRYETVNDESYQENVATKRTQIDPPEAPVVKKIKHASSEIKFRSFEIKWEKVSESILSRLHDLQQFCLQKSSDNIPKSLRLTKPQISSMINCIVEQLRMIDTQIGADVMEAVSMKIMHAYPCLKFLDDDGYGDNLDHVVFKYKLINRNSYLNRFKEEAAVPVVPVSRKEKKVRAGTSNEYWLKVSSECTADVHSKLKRDEPDLLSDEFLEASQAFIRHSYNTKKELKSILREMPVLRRRKLLYYHFEQATGTNIDTLQTYFAVKRAKIVEYSSFSRKALKLAKGCPDYEVFDFLAMMVGEKLSELVLKREVGTKLDDINEQSAGPVLIAIDMIDGKQMFYVYADQARITEGTTDFLVAMKDLMSAVYVYNFMYAKQAAKFLELVQQYLLKIIPVKGSKSPATRVNQQQRQVRTVIETLSSFEAGPSTSK